MQITPIFAMISSMIAKIEGTIDLITEKFLIITVSGIGYKVSVSTDTLASAKTGGNISLWTHLNVKEDALDLYGFMDRAELNFFEMLIEVSGVGPKSAMSIIGLTPIDIIQKAIASGDTSYLTKISGIGKKTAEKIVIELRDKLTALGHHDTDGKLGGDIDALEALQSLGYSQSEAREALKKVSPDVRDLNARLKEALQVLGGKSTS